MKPGTKFIVGALAALACTSAVCAQVVSPSAPPRFITARQAGQSQHVVIYGTSLSQSGAWEPGCLSSRPHLTRASPGLVQLTNSARGGQHSG